MSFRFTGLIVTAALISGCSAFMPDTWSDYQSWYKVTPEPTTGDPTGALDGEHSGTDAYRVIYVNPIGEAVNRGEEDFPYPEGTVFVKETYPSLERAESQSRPGLTVMVKLAEGESPGTNDWEFVAGGTGMMGLMRGAEGSRWGEFCGDCHVRAFATDYNFINSQFYEDNDLSSLE